MVDFLGIVSGKISTHNFSFTAQGKVKKFDYIKLYHDEAGFVLGQVNDLTNENNVISCDCEIIGYKDAESLLKVPKTTISSGTEIYKADNEFIKKILGLEKEDGLYIGVLDNYPSIKVMIDEKKIVTKHLAVLAKTGAGKSYTLGVIVEELLEKGVPVVIMDPHGEYSSLKYQNNNAEEIKKMKEYDVSPKSYKDKIVEYSPDVSINPQAIPLSINISSLSAHEIAMLTPIKIAGTQLGILYNAISEAKKTNLEYDLTDIKACVDEINSSAKYGLYSCLDFLENLGVFSKNYVNVESLVNPGKASLINLKGVDPEVQKIIVAKLCSDLFEKRKKSLIPPMFLIIEEAHNFCPERSFGESPSSHVLRNIASEGRKFGLGLGVVTQRPARIDKNVLSQCNTQIIHKVTNPNDLKAISSSAENLSISVSNDIPSIAVGTALIIGASINPLIVSIRPKKSLHGGKSVSFKTEPLNQVKAKKIDEVKVGISISNLFDSNKLIPAYLASINDGIKEYELLINQEADKILQAKEGQLIQAGINYSALSPKTRAVIDFLKSKGQVNLEALFNGLGYSFQDLDYIIKDLCAKDLIKNVNGKIFIKNDYSLFNFKGNIKSHEISAKIVENDYDNSANAKKFLIKIGLNPVKIRKIYIR
ncbi:MAG: ATP-binding protein [Candidatus Nanoarchaeia archaeon]|nr:ATP-binding protein [Candidatus Nanoarchaeia archaeon]MDD5053908.1 ATP-binding protein [Candidatus Nanoarchaeia archaeon]